MLKILKFFSTYFLIISCPPLFKVQYHKNYSMEKKFFLPFKAYEIAFNFKYFVSMETH